MEADIVNKEMDKLDNQLAQNRDNIDEETMRRLEDKFESLIPLYQCAKNTGITFNDQTKIVSTFKIFLFVFTTHLQIFIYM